MKTQNGLFRGWSVNLIFGGLAWFGVGIGSLLGLTQMGLLEQLLLLGPLVIMPLGLALIKIPAQARGQQRLHQLIKVLQPFGAAAVIFSFLWPQGLLAGALAAVWLGVTALIALLGLVRFLSKGYLDLLEIGLDAGLGYVAVGGGWLVLSRLGLQPLGFGDLIVLLTAVHFHYAGFAAPIISSQMGCWLTTFPKSTQRLHRITLLGVIAGMPLVAAGITFSPLLELIGAVELATSLVILAYFMITRVSKVINDRLARILLTVSAICLIIGMAFTYTYAFSEFTGYYLVIIPQMVRFHGVSNALGFVLCGLLACHFGVKR